MSVLGVWAFFSFVPKTKSTYVVCAAGLALVALGFGLDEVLKKLETSRFQKAKKPLRLAVFALVGLLFFSPEKIASRHEPSQMSDAARLRRAEKAHNAAIYVRLDSELFVEKGGVIAHCPDELDVLFFSEKMAFASLDSTQTEAIMAKGRAVAVFKNAVPDGFLNRHPNVLVIDQKLR